MPTGKIRQVHKITTTTITTKIPSPLYDPTLNRGSLFSIKGRRKHIARNSPGELDWRRKGKQTTGTSCRPDSNPHKHGDVIVRPVAEWSKIAIEWQQFRLPFAERNQHQSGRQIIQIWPTLRLGRKVFAKTLRTRWSCWREQKLYGLPGPGLRNHTFHQLPRKWFNHRKGEVIQLEARLSWI